MGFLGHVRWTLDGLFPAGLFPPLPVLRATAGEPAPAVDFPAGRALAGALALPASLGGIVIEPSFATDDACRRSRGVEKAEQLTFCRRHASMFRPCRSLRNDRYRRYRERNHRAVGDSGHEGCFQSNPIKVKGTTTKGGEKIQQEREAGRRQYELFRLSASPAPVISGSSQVTDKVIWLIWSLVGLVDCRRRLDSPPTRPHFPTHHGCSMGEQRADGSVPTRAMVL